MQAAFVPENTAGKFFYGTQPFGPCRVSGCEEPFGAWHEFYENGKPQRTCGKHLPPQNIFVPFLGQQSKMYYAPARWVLGGGGAGGSKTYMGSRLWLKQYAIEKQRFAKGEIKHSQGHCLFLRRTVPEIIQVVDQFLLYAYRLDPHMHWDGKHKLATFPSAGGFKVQFGGCEDVGAWKTYWGNAYTLVVLDEGVMFTFTQIDKLDQRIRCDDEVLDKMCQLYILTNPIAGAFDEETGLYTHSWLKERFVDPAPPEQPVRVTVELGDGRKITRPQVYIPSNVYDNPAYMKSGTYEASIRTRTVATQRQLLGCDWTVSEGAWCGTVWDATVHICKPFRIPPTWFRFKCADYGWDSRSSILWCAVDPDKSIVVYRSLCARLVNVKSLGIQIRQIEKASGEWDDVADMSKIPGPMDTELWAKHGDTGPSRAELINEVGCNFYKADKDPDSAAMQILVRLEHRSANARGDLVVPGLRFFDTCWNYLTSKSGKQIKVGPVVSVPICPSDPLKPDRWDTKADDHDLDALGYGCVSRPFPGTLETPIDRSQEAVYTRIRMKIHPPSGSPFPNWGMNNGNTN